MRTAWAGGRGRISAGLIVGLLAVFPALRQAAAAPPRISAVGLVDVRDGGGCTGTLIEPDLVLTAAHCVASGRREPERFAFRTGAYPGHDAVEVGVFDIAVHPFFRPAGPDDPAALAHDAALLRLEREVPPEVADPIPVSDRAGGDAMIVAALRGDATLRARERRCPVLGRSEGLLILSCAVRKGESGAPMLDRGPEGLSVVALVAAQSRIGRTETAIGPVAARLVGALRALSVAPRRP